MTPPASTVSADAALSRRGRLFVQTVSAALVAGWVLFLVGAVLGSHGPVPIGPLNDWAMTLLAAGAALSAMLRVVLVRDQRRVWLPLALGMVSYAIGAALWNPWLQHLPEPPFPSVADPLWLALYPLSYVTLVLSVRGRTGRLSASIWLDGLIGTLSVAALGTALLLGPMVDDATGSVAAIATNLAYPLCDVLLAAAVAGGFVLSGWRINRSWMLLAAGFVAFLAADVIYLKSTAEADYVTASLENLLWSGGVVLLARAAWAPTPPPATGRHRLAAPVPSMFAFAAVGILVYDHFNRIDAVSMTLAVSTVAAAMVRLMHTVREERRLWDTRRLAGTDELTGLPNRRALAHALDRALGDDGGDVVGLLVIDLNGFKELNDTLGHEAGDQVLRAVGLRLHDALRPEDMLVRLGGDEFAVVLDDCGSSAGAELVATRLLRSLEGSFPIMGIMVQIGASVGVACHPEHGRTASELLKRADVAMYRAKAARTGVERYDGTQDGRSAERLALFGQLGSAIAAGEIVPHYQPQIDPATGRTVGVEALARWEHPTHGVLGPAQFLPAIEQSNLSRLLTLSILEQAVAHCACWRDDGLDFPVAVNLSAANLVDDAFDTDVADILARHGVPAERLTLEITENIFLTDPDRALTLLHRLKAMGVRLSLDDFGTRHSSLSHLDRLPVDELKIDRSFVTELTTDQRTSIIVASTIQLAKRLGLHAVAEGIEDVATWSALAAMNCPAIQGYLVARPMPQPEFRAWALARPTAGRPTPPTPPAPPAEGAAEEAALGRNSTVARP
ncbi:MAG: diguanylate cyclase [Solirubrobacteraceae bacterium]|nr:diguanylate cyclase [Solirubrobacteraceae bacterium]